MQVKTKNVMFTALVVVLVGMLWYRVVYSPMESKASKAKAAAQDAETNSTNLQKAISDSTGHKKTVKSHDVATDVMLAAVPVDDAEASFLRGVDALRVSTGADWQSIAPSAPVASGTSASMNVGITVQGTEQQLLAYASGLGDMKRIFIIDNLTINGATAVGGAATGQTLTSGIFGGGLLQMQISGRIFAQPGAVTPPTGATSTGAAATTPVTSAPVATAPAGVQNN